MASLQHTAIGSARSQNGWDLRNGGVPSRNQGNEQEQLRALGLDQSGSEIELPLEISIEGLPDTACKTVLRAFPGAQRFHLC